MFWDRFYRMRWFYLSMGIWIGTVFVPWYSVKVVLLFPATFLFCAFCAARFRWR